MTKPIKTGRIIDWIVDELTASGHLEKYKCFQGTFVIAMDGVVYHSSTQVDYFSLDAPTVRTH